MKILILGSGGREHTFAWKIAQSLHCTELFVAPGNAGTVNCGTNVPISVTDFEAIKRFVIDNKIGLVVVGPEEPLVKGIYDYFIGDKQLQNIPVIGPSKEGAKLEGSKEYAKKFMVRHGIPTAPYKSFHESELENGLNFLQTLNTPVVLKADGLAAGKGVIICSTTDQAKKEFKSLLQGKFGAASKTVVIEEFLSGTEFSVFVLSDGKNYKILPVAKDYKRIGEGDTGLNTGGMGAISPVPFVDKDLMHKVEEEIIKPTIHGLANDNIIYKGFIYFGLIYVKGTPFVIEYNSRMGDPETEVVIPRIKSDFVDLLMGVANNNLNEKLIEIDDRACSTIMLVSGGYPEDYEKGKIINNIGTVMGSVVFHAGTGLNNNRIVTNGGRVVAVTSYGNTLAEALLTSNKNAEIIQFEKKYYRKDIGLDVLHYH